MQLPTDPQQPAAIADGAPPAALVRHDRVHRDVYTSAQVFALEREHLFKRAWLFVGHTSQIPQPGDFIAREPAGQPLIVVRQPDGSIAALANRCLHKGAPLVSEERGNIARMLRCPYHGWAYRPDGSLLAIPLRESYEGTPLAADRDGQGLSRYPNLVDHRGFLFVRLASDGPSFEQWFGPALAALDNMADRSPEGRLEVVGTPLRHRIRCNWKIYLENINDAMHPVSAHRSAAVTAKRQWAGQPADAPKPMAIEQMLPFGSDYEFFDGMGASILPNGHSLFGTRFNIHTSYGALDDYQRAMHEAYGAERAQEILGFRSQNTILYPTLSVKSSPVALRLLWPIAVDETVLESWSFRPVGAPDTLLERALTYNRVAFSPMSVVAHDDVHLFEAIQKQLASDANPWVNLQRDGGDTARLDDEGAVRREVASGSEALMRNQFRAWQRMMSQA
ncbi:MAG: aromatic ring-hydroxylating dioxygenase subunit alpha [Burkholderiaceae bacterium]